MSGRPLLEINNLKIVYDGAIEAVRDVSLTVPEGAIVALLGSNGAGKSTVLKTVSGVLAIEEGEIEKGTVVFEGAPISNRSAEEIVRRGLIQVPEGRRLFANMTVEENLMMGGYLQSPARMRELRDVVFDLFPRVAERRSQIAGYLSGGEQQMVAVGRALMASPKLLALDEPSLGLAPLIIDAIYDIVERLRREMGMTILLVEQSAAHALAVADYPVTPRCRSITSVTAEPVNARAFVTSSTTSDASDGYRDRAAAQARIRVPDLRRPCCRQQRVA